MVNHNYPSVTEIPNYKYLFVISITYKTVFYKRFELYILIFINRYFSYEKSVENYAFSFVLIATALTR